MDIIIRTKNGDSRSVPPVPTPAERLGDWLYKAALIGKVRR